MMFKLRWLPDYKGWECIPTSEQCGNEALSFRISREYLVDPDLFNEVGYLNFWSPIPSEGWGERIRHAVLDADYGMLESARRYRALSFTLILMELADAAISVDLALYRLGLLTP